MSYAMVIMPPVPVAADVFFKTWMWLWHLDERQVSLFKEGDYIVKSCWQCDPS